MANTTGGAAVAERPADSVWLSTLPTPRIAALSGLIPSVRPSAELLRVVHPAAGVLSDLPGPVTDLAVSEDGRHVVAAHYGQGAVSIIDVATLTVAAVVDGIAEPYAVAAAGRAYVRSSSIAEDSVVAVDLDNGSVLADREIGTGAGGLAVSRSGELLYVARSAGAGADIAVIDIESGHVSSIAVSKAPEARLDAVRVGPAGNRLYAALNTDAGGSLVVVDTRKGRVLNTVFVGASIGDIAVHPDGRRIFVTGWDAELGGVMRVVDTGASRVVQTIPTGGLPAQLVVTAGAVYLADGDQVVVVDTSTARIVDRIDLGRPVSCLAISGDGTHLYAGDYDGSIASLAVQSVGLGLRPAS